MNWSDRVKGAWGGGGGEINFFIELKERRTFDLWNMKEGVNIFTFNI